MTVTVPQPDVDPALEPFLDAITLRYPEGFMYARCPHCGGALHAWLREADWTHKEFVSCVGACGARLGWAADIHRDIVRRLRALGCDVKEVA